MDKQQPILPLVIYMSGNVGVGKSTLIAKEYGDTNKF